MNLPQAKSLEHLRTLYEQRRRTMTFSKEVELIETTLQQLQSIPVQGDRSNHPVVQTFRRELICRKTLICQNRMN